MLTEIKEKAKRERDAHKNPRKRKKEKGKFHKLTPPEDYSIPEAFNAFCSNVSLTAAKTSLTFVVSVACVRLTITMVIREGKRSGGRKKRTGGRRLAENDSLA
jgi:hypothetical protein